MKKITKATLIGFGLLVSAGVLSSCTASFCSKQDTAKIFFTGHKDTERNFVTKNNIAKKTNPAPKECKVCLFLLSLFLVLYQRSSIGISETA